MAIRIYIASPYTNGDKQDNVNLQMDVAHELLNRGYAPFTPTLSHYMQLRNPRPEHDWLKLDFQFLRCCDALIRIKPIKNGKEITSVGADQEETFARENNIPIFIFNNLEEMCVFLDERPFDLV
jgi:hypothetical protein